MRPIVNLPRPALICAALLITSSLFAGETSTSTSRSEAGSDVSVFELGGSPTGSTSRQNLDLTMTDVAVSSPPAVGPAPFERGSPAIASNGEGFLSVWWDERSGSTELFAARFDRNGALLDETGFRVASNVRRGIVAASSDGRDYVVAYGCREEGQPAALCLARIIAQSGQVEPGARLEAATYPALASNGNGYLLAFSDATKTPAPDLPIRHVSINADATLSGPSTLRGSSRYPATLTASDSRYLLCWMADKTLMGVILASDMSTTWVSSLASGIPDGWNTGTPSVASDGTEFLAVWVTPGSGLYSRRVLRDGTMSTPRQLVTDARVWQPQVTFASRTYVVSYISSGYFYGVGRVRRLTVATPGGLLSPAEDVFGTADEWVDSALSADGDHVVVLGQRSYEPQRLNQIEARVLDAVASLSSGAGEPFVLSTSVALQQQSVATRIGRNTVVAWRETVGPYQKGRVFLQRLDEGGQPLDGRGVAVSATERDQSTPVLGGSIVAWLEGDESEPFKATLFVRAVGSSRVDLQACKLEYSIVSPK